MPNPVSYCLLNVPLNIVLLKLSKYSESLSVIFETASVIPIGSNGKVKPIAEKKCADLLE